MGLCWHDGLSEFGRYICDGILALMDCPNAFMVITPPYFEKIEKTSIPQQENRENQENYARKSRKLCHYAEKDPCILSSSQQLIKMIMFIQFLAHPRTQCLRSGTAVSGRNPSSAASKLGKLDYPDRGMPSGFEFLYSDWGRPSVFSIHYFSLLGGCLTAIQEFRPNLTHQLKTKQLKYGHPPTSSKCYYLSQRASP